VGESVVAKIIQEIGEHKTTAQQFARGSAF